MKCKVCNSEENLEEHHIDANRDNNSRKNLIILCSSCHRQVHEKSELKHLKDDTILDLKDKLPERTKNQIKCHGCGYTWTTTSEMERVTCPSCNNKTKRINPKAD